MRTGIFPACKGACREQGVRAALFWASARRFAAGGSRRRYRATMRIERLETIDLRVLTSRSGKGADAVNRDPDHSAAYVILHTDGDLAGHGLTFTLGRGNEVCVRAIASLARHVEGASLDSSTPLSALGRLWAPKNSP